MPIKVNITLLDVGDGDSILIHLQKLHNSTKPADDLVMVVDGGTQQRYETKIRPALTNLLQKVNKEAPDIVVCTHYDSDHIGGLIPLAESYGTSVQEYWVHKVPILDGLDHSSINENLVIHINSFNDFKRDGKMYLKKNKFINEEVTLLLESIKQLNRFISKIPERKIRSVFTGYNLSHLGWPEVQVLGPSQNFYYDLFYSDEKYVESELQIISEHFRVDGMKSMMRLAMESLDPCSLVRDESRKISTSKTNLASIIFRIDDERRRYLFTGDAGIESFRSIPKCREELGNLYWLKVPHHASQNNISRELVELMKPAHAYSSGNRHQDDHVLDCIRKISGGKVFSTKTYGGDLHFP